jgi:nucleotide-binding universal stress UspA family protein
MTGARPLGTLAARPSWPDRARSPRGACVFERIVAGTDGSDTANLAMEHAVDIAERLGAQLVVVSAYRQADAGNQRGQPRRMQGAVRGPGFSAEGAIAGALLRDVEARHGKRLTLRTRAVPGDAATSLIQTAQEEQADLLVVGNLGMHRSQLLMRSIPGRVAHRAPISVLVVDTVHGRRPGYERILVGAGGSPSGVRAVEVAAELAERISATLTAAVVGTGPAEREAAGQLERRWPELDVRLMPGSPAAELCKLSESGRYDLLVVGNRGMGGPRRFLGSVPDKVSHRARTNVLIVHSLD